MSELSKKDFNKIKVAERFFRLHCTMPSPTMADIRDTLFIMATLWVPDSWRIVRNAVAFGFENNGQLWQAEAIHSLKNPVTNPDSPSFVKEMKPAKQPQCKKVSDDDYHRILSHLRKKGDLALIGAIHLAYLTGARPAEMLSMKFSPNHRSVFIRTAKQTEDGLRGLDRTLLFNEEDYQHLQMSHEWLKSERKKDVRNPELAMNRIQNRLAEVTKKLWPRRKHRPTLKSFRHQLGSNLKASGWDRKKIAAIMGHQSVESVSEYGNARSATRMPSMGVIEETVAKVKNTKLKEPHYKKFKERKTSSPKLK